MIERRNLRIIKFNKKNNIKVNFANKKNIEDIMRKESVFDAEFGPNHMQAEMFSVRNEYNIMYLWRLVKFKWKEFISERLKANKSKIICKISVTILNLCSDLHKCRQASRKYHKIIGTKPKYKELKKIYKAKP
jgi:hypothetical protein